LFAARRLQAAHAGRSKSRDVLFSTTGRERTSRLAEDDPIQRPLVDGFPPASRVKPALMRCHTILCVLHANPPLGVQSEWRRRARPGIVLRLSATSLSRTKESWCETLLLGFVAAVFLRPRCRGWLRRPRHRP